MTREEKINRIIQLMEQLGMIPPAEAEEGDEASENE